MFEFLLKTGEASISGSQFVSKRTNSQSQIIDGNFNIFEESSFSSSPKFKVRASLNSQSLVEDNFSVFSGIFDSVYSSTGDYFLTSSNVENAIYGFKFSDSLNFQSVNGDDVLYDLVGSGYSAIFQYTNTGSIPTGLKNQIVLKNLVTGTNFSNLQIFANGQKIYKDKDFSVSGGNFVFNIGFTGKIWAEEKNSFLSSKTGVSFFSTGHFIENNNNYYYEGMEQPTKFFLEANSFVPLISFEKESKFEIDKLEITGVFL